jgi:hypothetical protein
MNKSRILRKIFSIIIILLIASSALPQSVNWNNGTFEEVKYLAKVENKLILFYIYEDKG